MIFMAKKGNSYHTKRMSISNKIPVYGRKQSTWSLGARPGPHSSKRSISAAVLLRDELKLCSDIKEAKKILNSGSLLIDGKICKCTHRPVGIMDIISIPKVGKFWRMQVVGGRIKANEIDSKVAKVKYCKVCGKKTAQAGKIIITLHDGRNQISDKSVTVGSTLKMSVPEFKMLEKLPMQKGARCVIIDGKHAGKIATLMDITQSAGSMPSRATLKSPEGEFITLANYLVVVDADFQ